MPTTAKIIIMEAENTPALAKILGISLNLMLLYTNRDISKIYRIESTATSTRVTTPKIIPKIIIKGAIMARKVSFKRRRKVFAVSFFFTTG